MLSSFFILLILSFAEAKNKGLINGGNHCRHNSMLQALYNVPLLRDLVLNHPGDVKISPVNNNNSQIDVKRVFRNLQANVLDSCMAVPTAQEPAIQTFTALATVLDKDIDAISGFHYLRKTTILVQNGKDDYVRARDFTSLDNLLEVKMTDEGVQQAAPVTLQDFLNRQFINQEGLMDSKDPAYPRRPVRRVHRIGRTGPVLFVRITRAVQDENLRLVNGLVRYLIRGLPLPFEETLTVNSYSDDGSQLTEKIYNLVSVARRHGDYADAGHFTAYAKEADGSWIDYNDSTVTPASKAEVLGSHKSDDLFLAYVEDVTLRKIVPSTPLNLSVFERFQSKEPFMDDEDKADEVIAATQRADQKLKIANLIKKIKKREAKHAPPSPPPSSSFGSGGGGSSSGSSSSGSGGGSSSSGGGSGSSSSGSGGGSARSPGSSSSTSGSNSSSSPRPKPAPVTTPPPSSEEPKENEGAKKPETTAEKLDPFQPIIRFFKWIRSKF